MNRKAILDRIVGPIQHRDPMSWEFTYMRPIDHRSKEVKGRRLIISYFPKSRDFKILSFRRVSKRKKQQQVYVCSKLLVYLRSRLSPADIARCTAASLTRKEA